MEAASIGNSWDKDPVFCIHPNAGCIFAPINPYMQVVLYEGSKNGMGPCTLGFMHLLQGATFAPIDL